MSFIPDHVFMIKNTYPSPDTNNKLATDMMRHLYENRDFYELRGHEGERQLQSIMDNVYGDDQDDQDDLDDQDQDDQDQDDQDDQDDEMGEEQGPLPREEEEEEEDEVMESQHTTLMRKVISSFTKKACCALELEGDFKNFITTGQATSARSSSDTKKVQENFLYNWRARVKGDRCGTEEGRYLRIIREYPNFVETSIFILNGENTTSRQGLMQLTIEFRGKALELK
ncbi:cell division protein SepF [Acrasis kona]|uniref:Cell division protein SepF n=1 Tax=Acrasis kona TaxID=1008807 RepID=A0AAW2ZGG6_9EUKA